MKLLAPVNSFSSLVKQVEAGADEVYLGGDTEVFANFSFSGRGKYNPEGVKICADYRELQDIVQYAHQHNISVMYAANLPFLADDPDGGQSYERHFLNYVEEGLKAGVDSVVVADIGLIMLLRDKGIKIHITASTFLETVNQDQILFLKELGVNRVVLSYQVTLPEVEALSRANIMEVEVFGHYGCSFYDGYCNMKHFFGETRATGIGVPCQGVYRLVRGETLLGEGDYLNASLVCSICSLPRLKKAGVHAVKLVGRSKNMDQNVQITSVYAQTLKYLDAQEETGPRVEERYQEFREDILPRWWKQGICRHHLCKYKKNDVTNSFVG